MKRAKFITIERPLLPAPPKDAEPYWCYLNTLMFKDKKTRRTLWEQKIPEAQLSWKPLYRYDDDKKEYVFWKDDFDAYFRCSVFKDDNFGWQLRLIISHEYANVWHKRMMDYIEKYHQAHFLNDKWWIDFWVDTPQIDILQYVDGAPEGEELDCMIQQAVGEYIEKIL